MPKQGDSQQATFSFKCARLKDFIPEGMSGKLVLLVFIGLIVLNLILTLSYTAYSRYDHRLAFREEITSQIVNIMHLMEVSSTHERQRIASISSGTALKVSTSTTPVWKNQAHNDSMWELNTELTKSDVEDYFRVSIQLADGSWVNFRFEPKSQKLGFQFTILIFETIMAIWLLFFVWYVERFTKPLRQFKRAAEQLGIELKPLPIVEYGPPIVRETADAMNQMQKRITDLIADRTRMLAAISHDLRTPITRMKLRAQFLEDKEVSRDQIQDLDEMETMISQILAYAKDAANVEAATTLDLSALIVALCDEKSEQGYDVTCEAEISRALMPGRPLALKRALNNLLNNAVKYAKHIKVSIRRVDKHYEIIIDDDGPGIPPSELEKVFTPFYRIDSSRNSKTGGSGLGLAIVQDIVRAHRGSIQLSNLEPTGLRVRVLFEA